MAQVGSMTNAGRQWILAQTGDVDMLEDGYARLGDGYRSAADIPASTALQGTPIPGIGVNANGQLPVTMVSPARDTMGTILNLVVQAIDAGGVGYSSFTEVGVFNADGTLVFYYCDDAGDSIGAKISGTQNVLELNMLITLSQAQQLPPGTVFVISDALTVPDDSITAPKIQSSAVINRHLANETIEETKLHSTVQAKIHSVEEIQDIIGAMVDGNTETQITVTYNDTDGKLNFVADVKTDEELQDFIAAMFTGGTHSKVTIAYDDDNDVMNVTVDPLIRKITFGTAARPAQGEAGSIYMRHET